MEEAIIGARIRDILEQKIMGAGDMEGAVDDLTEMMTGAGYGTRKGARKAVRTRKTVKRVLAARKKRTGSKKKKGGVVIGGSKRRVLKRSKSVGSKRLLSRAGIAVGGKRRLLKAKSGSKSAKKKTTVRKNPWLSFLAKFRKANKHLSPQEIMHEAAIEYRSGY